MKQKYIWLFGENGGQTANNNSFYMWKHIVDRHFYELDAFFIAEKTPGVMTVYKTLSDKMKSRIIWRNSIRHISLFIEADMLFVTLSYTDVQPQNVGPKSYKPMPVAPLVYLQHGTLAIKQLGYENNYANNTMFRFLIYNPRIRQKLIDINGFKAYQIHDAVFHPRYAELAHRFLSREPSKQKKIFWFITWREYFDDGMKAKLFVRSILRVLHNSQFIQYTQDTGCRITICLHRNFAERHVEMIQNACKKIPHAEVVYSADVDVMDYLVSHDVLITDYSSIAFDFTFLKKPVVLYQPDFEEYIEHRKLYCGEEELRSVNIEMPRRLVETIVSEQYGINPFFIKNSHECTDMEEVASGKYIEQLYQYFWKKEQKSVAVLGYDFSGIGGTVFATRALMEGLLEKGFLVRAYTLKQIREFKVPSGLALKPATKEYGKRLGEKIAQKAVWMKKNYSYLQYDPLLKYIHPLAGKRMTRWMKNIHANTVISTRESLHLFLQSATSDMIHNKVYYFHTSAAVVESLFPGVMGMLQETGIEKAAFVTEKNRMALAEFWGYLNYKSYVVTGNSVDSSRSLTENEICKKVDWMKENLHADRAASRRKGTDNTTRCMTMLRINKDRSADLDYLLGFANEIRTRGVDDILISIYGGGDYVDEFLNEVDRRELDEYIEYCGETEDIKSVIADADVLVDFSKIQSFGMTYIEAILNGCMILCRHNEGSDEVLADMPDAFYKNYLELIEKIHGVKRILPEQLYDNYKAISKRYGRTAVVQRLISLIGDES